MKLNRKHSTVRGWDVAPNRPTCFSQIIKNYKYIVNERIVRYKPCMKKFTPAKAPQIGIKKDFSLYTPACISRLRKVLKIYNLMLCRRWCQLPVVSANTFGRGEGVVVTILFLRRDNSHHRVRSSTVNFIYSRNVMYWIHCEQHNRLLKQITR